MMRALYVLQYAKKACFRTKQHRTVKKSPVVLAIIELHLPEGRQAGRRAGRQAGRRAAGSRKFH